MGAALWLHWAVFSGRFTTNLKYIQCMSTSLLLSNTYLFVYLWQWLDAFLANFCTWISQVCCLLGICWNVSCCFFSLVQFTYWSRVGKQHVKFAWGTLPRVPMLQRPPVLDDRGMRWMMRRLGVWYIPYSFSDVQGLLFASAQNTEYKAPSSFMFYAPDRLSFC